MLGICQLFAVLAIYVHDLNPVIVEITESIKLRWYGFAYLMAFVVGYFLLKWLADKKLVIAGDMAFHKRMLPIFEYTDTAGWLNTWEKFAALGAKYVIPGHGEPTNMEEVTRYTKGYLMHLREKIGVLIEEGGSMQDAYEIDQSAYMHLPTAEILAKRNAGQVFQAMEFE